MQRVLIAKLAILLHLKFSGLILLILCNGIITPLTILTGQQYNISHFSDL
jgi:hypothetical protein